MVSRWNQRDSNSLQVSKTPLSILAHLNNAVVWTVSTRLLIYKFASPCTKTLLTLPRALITTGMTVTFTFHACFNSLERSGYSYFFSLSFNFTLWSARTAKSTIRQVLFFMLTISRSVRLPEMR